MVKLTTDIIERKYSQILTRKSLSKTINKEELWKLTHLHMNDMFINDIVSHISLINRLYIYVFCIKFCLHRAISLSIKA
jgi:hypothetical protein